VPRKRMGEVLISYWTDWNQLKGGLGTFEVAREG